MSSPVPLSREALAHAVGWLSDKEVDYIADHSFANQVVVWDDGTPLDIVCETDAEAETVAAALRLLQLLPRE